MTVQYVWSIEDLNMTDVEVASVAYTDVVSEIHWRLNASETVGADTYHATEYGSVSLDPNDVDSDTFVEFADLGGLTIVEWAVAVINSEDADKVADMKTRLAATIGAAQVTVVKKMPTDTSFDDSLLT